MTIESSATIERLRAAVSQWTVFAIEAERGAHRRQRTTVLDLLQAARQIALGVEAVRQLDESHARQTRMLMSVRASATGLTGRLEDRIESLRVVVAAASKTHAAAVALPISDRGSAEAVGRLRTEATTILQHGTETLSSLEVALDDARSALSSSAHMLSTLDAVGLELAELRTRFERLGRQAAESLATLRAAGQALASSSELYEAAQRAAFDLRREMLAPPTGEPLTGPTVPPIPVLAGVA